MKALGCSSVLIGHCEERRDKLGIMAEAGVKDTDAVNRILNQEIKAAVDAGLSVLYCIGESAEEQAGSVGQPAGNRLEGCGYVQGSHSL